MINPNCSLLAHLMYRGCLLRIVTLYAILNKDVLVPRYELFVSSYNIKLIEISYAIDSMVFKSSPPVVHDASHVCVATTLRFPYRHPTCRSYHSLHMCRRYMLLPHHLLEHARQCRTCHFVRVRAGFISGSLWVLLMSWC